MPYQEIDLSAIKTYPASARASKETVACGRVDIRVQIHDESEAGIAFDLNLPRARAYHEALHQLTQALDLTGQVNIDTVLARAAFPWKHVKHEDNGICQVRIKNLAVRYATGAYLVFIDHDVALHPDFLKDHLRMAQQGCFLQGKRVFLSKGQTETAFHTKCLTAFSPFSRRLENRKNALRWVGLRKMLARPKTFQSSLRGCNLSTHKSDCIAVNGYSGLS